MIENSPKRTKLWAQRVKTWWTRVVVKNFRKRHAIWCVKESATYHPSPRSVIVTVNPLQGKTHNTSTLCNEHTRVRALLKITTQIIIFKLKAIHFHISALMRDSNSPCFQAPYLQQLKVPSHHFWAGGWCMSEGPLRRIWGGKNQCRVRNKGLKQSAADRA